MASRANRHCLNRRESLAPGTIHCRERAGGGSGGKVKSGPPTTRDETTLRRPAALVARAFLDIFRGWSIRPLNHLARLSLRDGQL